MILNHGTRWTIVLDEQGEPIIGANIVEKGTTNGTISVDGDDVEVKGLGSAAYTNADAYDEKGAASAVLGTAADGADVATVYGVKAAIAATNTEVGKKIDATKISAIGKSGNVKDLLQTEGDVLVFNCGTASTVIWFWRGWRRWIDGARPLCKEVS